MPFFKVLQTCGFFARQVTESNSPKEMFLAVQNVGEPEGLLSLKILLILEIRDSDKKEARDRPSPYVYGKRNFKPRYFRITIFRVALKSPACNV